MNDKERPGQPKKFEEGELETLLQENSCQMLKKLSETLNIHKLTVCKRLKAMRIQKLRKLGSIEIKRHCKTFSHL